MSIETIRSSSQQDDFCKDAAAKIANFFDGSAYPLERDQLEPFFDVITEEVMELMKMPQEE